VVPRLLLLIAVVLLVAVRGTTGASASYTIWPSTATPAVVADPEIGSGELGVKFTSDSSGYITAIRFYKGSTNTGTHVGNLWANSGTLLATATFTNETASGWQQVSLPTPIAIVANTVYVASYHINVGHYSVDEKYFTGKGMDSAPLHALANGVSGTNGVFAGGATSSFPNQSWNASNYWVDVVFTPSLSADITPPTVTAFTIPATATTLTVSITSFAANDDVAVTGYLVTETATAPSPTAAGWSAAPPTSYTFTTAGSKTLYAWAKDAAGNVSASKSAAVTITLADTTKPVVTAFTVPATATTLTVPITALTATDNVAVTGYLVNESATAPSPTATGWSAAAPTSYTCTTAGGKTLYAWAKDAAGNVSASKTATVTITLSDATKPTITAFTVPATATTLTVPITTFTATDNVAVTGFLVNESSTTPSATAAGWSSTAQTSYTCTTAGSKTLYAWAKDAAGNVSASRNATVVITLSSSSGPEPAGWYAGDMHVHRSCGGSPEAISSVYQKMAAQNLAVVTLLADMGNGEVQSPAQDLPRVNGLDDPVSTPGRIVHWDAEWHWDATYGQYAHQALGGHVVALGLREAHQIWEEYTYPIFAWAHQQNAIAGFAHMDDLIDGVAQNLNCCVPIEYPIEAGLGSSDFIDEDVLADGTDQAIQAYYRLLNNGFRPGLAAGTDYPCSGLGIGDLLTYVQVGSGQMTYANWVAGIAKGRTVVSRNGHNEFLNLTVNGNATPGDEIKLTAAGQVQVTVQWTATQNLTGTIELVHNGVVVASQQTSVAAGTPATLTATVDVPKSGWLAALRTNSAGHHKVHTSAVFVTVNNAPVRASATDAQFYVQWADTLLQNTSPGGVWSSYFPTNRAAAQARYQAAKAAYQQIASESDPIPAQPGSIFTSQTPTSFENDWDYELGTAFWADVAGQVTQARLYTNTSEGGNHTVRIWRASDNTLVAGPYTWTISSGTEGWKTFTLPTPADIAANTAYIVAVSNSTDRYYAVQPHGCDATIVNGNLHTYVGSGLWTDKLGTMPTLNWQNANFFRDIVFVPRQ
jgi:hypothetical protein